jgi:hypothetical protein
MDNISHLILIMKSWEKSMKDWIFGTFRGVRGTLKCVLLNISEILGPFAL